MSRIFGDRGRLESKMPRLQASSNSFVKVDVEVRQGLQCTAAIGVRPTRSDDALYSSVVKQVIGGSYVEERDAKRDLAVRAWWDLLRLDMLCSDPGRIAMQEKGLADIYRNGIEILDASLGVKSPNTVMKRLYAVKTYNTWVIRCNGKSLAASGRADGLDLFQRVESGESTCNKSNIIFGGFEVLPLCVQS